MTSDLWAFVMILAVAVLSMPVYAFGGARESPDPNASANRGSFVLGSFVRDWFYWFLGPVERASLAAGLGPLLFNLLGVTLGLFAGALFAAGSLALGGWSVLLGGVADILDGRVARARGMASRRGAFLDSSLDRFAEVAVFVGLAVLFHGSALALCVVVVGMGGSLLVSYTRARGESVGVLCTVGVMQRAERLILVGFGAVLDPVLSGALDRATPGALLLPVLTLVAVGTVSTAIYRTVWIAKRLPELDE